MRSRDRTLLLFLVCIPVRVSLSVFVFFLDRLGTEARLVTAVLLMIAATGFVARYASFSRRGILGGDVWWNSLRPFHFFTFFLSSLLLIVNPPLESVSSYILGSDAVVSFLSAGGRILLTRGYQSER